MDEDVAEVARRIEAKLDTTLRVLAYPLVAGKSLPESVELLARLGFDRNQIAVVCDTTPGTVSVRLSEAKRKRAAAQKASEKQNELGDT